HHQHFEELDRLREMYFDFDPEVAETRRPARDLENAYRTLSDEFVRLLTEANFVEIPREVISRAFGEHALVRVKIKASVGEYRNVRMFRRGVRRQTIEIPEWFGLRRRSLEVEFYDDGVLMVATAPEVASTAGSRNSRGKTKKDKAKRKIRSGAVLFKYFRDIARGDLEALLPNVRVVMSVFDQFALGVPAIVGGVPILLKLAS